MGKVPNAVLEELIEEFRGQNLTGCDVASALMELLEIRKVIEKVSIVPGTDWASSRFDKRSEPYDAMVG